MADTVRRDKKRRNYVTKTPEPFYIYCREQALWDGGGG